jgi:hypothetical protein
MDSIGFTDTISIPPNTNKDCLLHQRHQDAVTSSVLAFFYADQHPHRPPHGTAPKLEICRHMLSILARQLLYSQLPYMDGRSTSESNSGRPGSVGDRCQHPPMVEVRIKLEFWLPLAADSEHSI